MDMVNSEKEFLSITESGKIIKDLADDLSKEIDLIFYTVSDLDVSCDGETSTKFNIRVKSYADDLEAMVKAFEEYAEYLLNYEHELRKIEEDLSVLATCLPKCLLEQ